MTAMSDLVGELVGQHYRLLEVLGHGGQAIVYRAIDVRSGQAVAVKVVDRRAARDAAVVERMAREQQAMVALAGTNAVAFLDMCTTRDGALCLVMELLEGMDLEALLEQHERTGE